MTNSSPTNHFYLFHRISRILLNNRLDCGNIIFRGGQNWSIRTGLIFSTRSTLFKIRYPSGNCSFWKSILSVHCIQFRLNFWCASIGTRLRMSSIMSDIRIITRKLFAHELLKIAVLNLVSAIGTWLNFWCAFTQQSANFIQQSASG